jgi:hypothetical protein
LTVTRPWRINSSALRREATPARARNFCRRSSESCDNWTLILRAGIVLILGVGLSLDDSRIAPTQSGHQRLTRTNRHHRV